MNDSSGSTPVAPGVANEVVHGVAEMIETLSQQLGNPD